MDQPNKMNMSLLFRKVGQFIEKKNLFMDVCKNALKIKKVKEIPNDAWFLEKLNNPAMKGMIVQSVVNQAMDWAYNEEKAKLRKDYTGFFLPSVDNISGSVKFANIDVKGLKIPFLRHDGTIVTLTKWTNSKLIHISHIHDESKEVKMPLPYFYKVVIEVTETEKYGPTLNFLKYIDKDTVLSSEELQKALLTNSKTLNQISEKDRFNIVILRRMQFNNMIPIELWVKTGAKKTVKRKSSGISTDEEYEVDELKQIPEGQEFLQNKYGTEENPIQIPCFGLKTFTDVPNNDNFMNMDMVNNQYGEPIIWLGGWKDMIVDAVKNFGNKYLPKENNDDNGEPDPFKHLTSYLRSTELLVMGRIGWMSNRKEKGISAGMELSFLSDLRFPLLDKGDRHIKLIDPNIYVNREMSGKIIAKGNSAVFETVNFNFKVPKDVDIDFSGNLEEMYPQEEESEMDKVYAHQIAENISEQQDGDSNKEFAIWMNTMTANFNKAGFIHEDKLDEELILILMETLNIWAPNNPQRYELADGKITPDNGGMLLDYWEKIIVQAPGVVETKTETGSTIKEVETSKDVPHAIDKDGKNIQIPDLDDNEEEVTIDDLRKLFTSITEITFDDLEIHILDVLKMTYETETLVKQLDELVSDGTIVKVGEDGSFSYLKSKPEPKSKDIQMSTIVGITDPKILNKKSVKELRMTAREVGIKGYSSLKKNELIDVIITKTKEIKKDSVEIETKVEDKPEDEPEVDVEPQTDNLSSKEKEDINELENVLRDILSNDNNVTVDEIYANYAAILPANVDLGYQPIIQKMLDSIRSKL